MVFQSHTRTRPLAWLLAALLLASFVPSARAHIDARSHAWIDPKVLDGSSPRAIVLFRHDVSAGTIERLAAAGIERALVFDAIDAVAVDGPTSAYAAIATWDDVLAVDDDSRIVFHNQGAKVDTKVDRVRTGTEPLATGYDGEGVTVALLDSGVDSTHPDLSDRFGANLYMEPAFVFDPISDGTYSERFAEVPATTDEVGHGTHVAGIIGGSGRAGKGADMSGVAPGATLVNCKIGFGSAVNFESIALACFQWILDHQHEARFPGGIRVINNSWGLDNEDLTGQRPLELMIKATYAAGITNVFSAGNTGPGEDTVFTYPNSMEEVITVGATCKSAEPHAVYCDDPLEISSFSARGLEVDVVAPGVNIWSARSANGYSSATGIATGSQQIPGSPDLAAMASNRVNYVPKNGTSMASPHVAGIVALMLDANPALRPADIESILTTSAVDLGQPGFDTSYGFGFVDALAAVLAAEPG